jgi:hypothetical protein
MGGIMLVHGGYNTEGKVTLDDFNLFDFDTKSWVNTEALTNGIFLESKAKFGVDKSKVMKLDESIIGQRQMHSICAIYNDEFYSQKYRGDNQLSHRNRAMWRE